MQQFLVAIIVLLAIALVIYAVVFLFKKLSKKIEAKTDEQFKKLGQALNLESTRKIQLFNSTKWQPLCLEGTIDTLRCGIFTEEVDSHDGYDFNTIIEVEVEEGSGIFFELYRNNSFFKLLHGHTNVDFNHPTFSKYFLIRTTDVDKVQKIFSTALMDQLIKNRKAFLYMSKLRLKNGKMKISLQAPMYVEKYRKDVFDIVQILIAIASSIKELPKTK
ncbi:MAG: DUF3137 domain-containing protein [Chitinophagales bacterium]|nr:DUF3137 domain-containing protein [Chitinophagales bacterium]